MMIKCFVNSLRCLLLFREFFRTHFVWLTQNSSCCTPFQKCFISYLIFEPTLRSPNKRQTKQTPCKRYWTSSWVPWNTTSFLIIMTIQFQWQYKCLQTICSSRHSKTIKDIEYSYSWGFTERFLSVCWKFNRISWESSCKETSRRRAWSRDLKRTYSTWRDLSKQIQD